MKKLIISTIITAVLTANAFAEWKPKGNIDFRVGFGAGGSTDTMARVIANEIERIKGWNVVVSNKPGAGGIAMFNGINKAGKKDGTVIGMGVTSPIQITLAKKGKKFPIQPDSLTYVGTISLAPSALVTTGDAPYNNLKEFINWSKSNGGKGIFIAQTPEQSYLAKQLNKKYGLKLKIVKVKGGAKAMQMLLSGNGDVVISSGPHVKMLKAKKVKVLAVVTENRHSYTNAKTLKEQGLNEAFPVYFFLALPKDTDKKAQKVWEKTLNEVLKTQKVRKIISALGGTNVNIGSKKLKQEIIDGSARYKKILSK